MNTFFSNFFVFASEHPLQSFILAVMVVLLIYTLVDSIFYQYTVERRYQQNIKIHGWPPEHYTSFPSGRILESESFEKSRGFEMSLNGKPLNVVDDYLILDNQSIHIKKPLPSDISGSPVESSRT